MRKTATKSSSWESEDEQYIGIHSVGGHAQVGGYLKSYWLKDFPQHQEKHETARWLGHWFPTFPCKLSPFSPVPIPLLPEILATLSSTVYSQLSTHLTAYPYRFIVFIFMCFCLCEYTWGQVPMRPEEGSRYLWTGFTGCELFDTGAGKQTWVLCKYRTCTWLLSCLSSPDIPIFLYLVTWPLDYLGKYLDYLGNCSQMDLVKTYLSQR